MEKQLIKLITANYTSKGEEWITRGQVHSIIKRILKGDYFSSGFSCYKGEKYLIVTIYVGKSSKLHLYFETNGKMLERLKYSGYKISYREGEIISIVNNTYEEDIKQLLEIEESVIIKEIETILDTYKEISGKNLDEIRKLVKTIG